VGAAGADIAGAELVAVPAAPDDLVVVDDGDDVFELLLQPGTNALNAVAAAMPMIAIIGVFIRAPIRCLRPGPGVRRVPGTVTEPQSGRARALTVVRFERCFAESPPEALRQSDDKPRNSAPEPRPA
jgi:hypothetical protein